MKAQFARSRGRILRPSRSVVRAVPQSNSDLYPRFLRLLAFNILANIVVPLAGLVDTAMLGHSPDLSQLSGVALATVLFNYVYWTFGFLRMATTGESAQALGRGDRLELYRVLLRALSLALGLGLLILVLQPLIARGGFLLLGGEPAVRMAGQQYFYARIWGAPAALMNFVWLGWFLGREQSGRALIMALATNAVNVGGNYLLIVELGLGAYGAGISTAVSNWAAWLVALLLFHGVLRGDREANAPDLLAAAAQCGELWRADRLRALYSLNRDIMIRTFVLVSAFSIFTALSAQLGTAVLAANAILLRFVELAAYLIDGAAFAAESLAGNLRGAGRREAFDRMLWLAFGSALAAAVAFCIPLLAVPELVVGWMTDKDQLIADLVALRLWLLPILVPGAVAFVHDGVYLGFTEGRELRNRMLWSFGLGFAPWACAAWFWQQEWLLWLSMALFMLARAVTLELGLRPIIARAFARPADSPCE